MRSIILILCLCLGCANFVSAQGVTPGPSPAQAKIRLKESSAAPSSITNEVVIYAKDKAGVSKPYFKDSAGTEVELAGTVVGAMAVTTLTASGEITALAVNSDTISEKTADTGVTVDGLKFKDAGFDLAGDDADGDLYYRASGALTRLAKGATPGQVLQMNADTTAPEWASAAQTRAALGISEYGTVYVDAIRMITCTTNGAGTETHEYASDKPEMTAFAFDGGATEERVQFKLIMPHDWDAGTLKAKLHWSSATGSTAGDGVVWAIRAVGLADDAAMAASFGDAQAVTDTLHADNGTDMQITDATQAITVSAAGTGRIICFEICRKTGHAGDDMAEDAWLFGTEILYRKSETAAAGW